MVVISRTEPDVIFSWRNKQLAILNSPVPRNGWFPSLPYFLHILLSSPKIVLALAHWYFLLQVTSLKGNGHADKGKQISNTWAAVPCVFLSTTKEEKEANRMVSVCHRLR